MPKISVIIPNYNCAQWLKRTVESCVIQKYLHEIIIVDDHSQDDSWELMQALHKQYPDILHIYKNTKKGANYARNLGFEKSSGNYIQWLDADDYLLKGKFENQINTFAHQANADIVYSDWYMDFYDKNLQFVNRESHKSCDYQDFTLEILMDNWLMSSSYLLRRATAERLHNLQAWYPDRKVAQDREYFTIAALTGAKFKYCKGYFCVYNRWSTNQISAINFNLRLKYQLQLELKFRNIIVNNNYDKKTKRLYLSILNAHTMNACFYNRSLTIIKPFSFFNIYWAKIHWKKRLFIPFIYIWQHIKHIVHFNSLRLMLLF